MNDKPWNPQPLNCHYDTKTGDVYVDHAPEQIDVDVAFLQLSDPDCVEFTVSGLKFTFANKTAFELLSDEEVKAYDPE
jgi:hypothetical protein